MIISSKPKQSKQCPADNHVSRCIQLIRYGTIKKEFAGEVKFNDTVRIVWETPNEKTVFSEEKGEQPFTLYKEFKISLHEKATLRKFIESWRGAPLTDAEARKFDLSSLLGQPCMLNVTHTTKGDATYANIAAISKLPKGLDCPPAINPLIEYDVNAHKPEVFAKFPDFIKEKIKSSAEWAANGLKDEAPASSEESKSDIPF